MALETHDSPIPNIATFALIRSFGESAAMFIDLSSGRPRCKEVDLETCDSQHLSYMPSLTASANDCHQLSSSFKFIGTPTMQISGPGDRQRFPASLSQTGLLERISIVIRHAEGMNDEARTFGWPCLLLSLTLAA